MSLSDRLLEVAIVSLAATSAAAARIIFSIINSKDYPPIDPQLRQLWLQRMRWAVVGEVAAIITFVLVAEAVVMLRELSGPAGVLIGAGAAVLGYPFLAGLLRRRVERKMQEGEQL